MYILSRNVGTHECTFGVTIYGHTQVHIFSRTMVAREHTLFFHELWSHTNAYSLTKCGHIRMYVPSQSMLTCAYKFYHELWSHVNIHSITNYGRVQICILSRTKFCIGGGLSESTGRPRMEKSHSKRHEPSFGSVVSMVIVLTIAKNQFTYVTMGWLRLV